MENKELIIKEIVGSANWIQVSDGAKVYAEIQPLLSTGTKVVLSFAGRDFVITAFLNAAIGKLYNGQFTEEQLSLLSYANTDPSDDAKIRRVIDNAKLYYGNNPGFRNELFKQEAEA